METQDYEQRKFIIFNVSELNNIDFSQVLETSIDTVRKSVDGLTTKEGPYTYEEIIEILNTPEWTTNDVI